MRLPRMKLMRRRKSGQGMIEYGLIVGLMSVWVVILFLALKPIFTEKFASDNIVQKAGEGRAQLAAGLGVKTSYTTDAEGRVTADDW